MFVHLLIEFLSCTSMFIRDVLRLLCLPDAGGGGESRLKAGHELVEPGLLLLLGLTTSMRAITSYSKKEDVKRVRYSPVLLQLPGWPYSPSHQVRPSNPA